MPDSYPSQTHLRSALFVDFDNIYLGLQREDPNAAEQFATNPAHWLHWLQESLSLDSEELGGRPKRKILFRRCYLNPSQFGRFRPYFTRSAFEVVDCPPLTSGGKTSADIQMVMDILDALGHTTRFEEFIILSGDADFTPVLLRLSKHDRRSAVLAVGPASVAYKAACDLLIDQDIFLEEAIGVIPAQSTRAEGPRHHGHAGAAAPASPTRSTRRRAPAASWWRPTCRASSASSPEFTSSTNWLGFNSLRNMTMAVVQARPDLEMVDGDPWKVRVGEGTAEERGQPAAGTASGSPIPPTSGLAATWTSAASPRRSWSTSASRRRRLGLGGAHGARGPDGDQPLRRRRCSPPAGRAPAPSATSWKGARTPASPSPRSSPATLRPRAAPGADRRPSRRAGVARSRAELPGLPGPPAHRHALPDAAASTPRSSATSPRR